MFAYSVRFDETTVKATCRNYRFISVFLNKFIEGHAFFFVKFFNRNMSTHLFLPMPLGLILAGPSTSLRVNLAR
jgi:hypothetical protein